MHLTSLIEKLNTGQIMAFLEYSGAFFSLPNEIGSVVLF